MNHYPHHIGDFNSATMHLTFVERALYRELLDLYYDTERPLNGDVQKLARRVRAVTDELRQALDIVLEEFFIPKDDGWHNERCDAELVAYRQKQEQQRRAGQASAKARGSNPSKPAKPNAGATGDEPGEGLRPSGSGANVERPFNERSTNQNQNQNQYIPPNPPAGGTEAGEAAQSEQKPATKQPVSKLQNPVATVAQLMAFFPAKRRTRTIEVGRMLTELVEAGTVSERELLAAAAAQSAVLCLEDGKSCPNVLRWLKEERWRDPAVTVTRNVTGDVTGVTGVAGDWRRSRSGIEAMGAQLGVKPWDEEKEKLFKFYEDRVIKAYNEKFEVERVCQ